MGGAGTEPGSEEEPSGGADAGGNATESVLPNVLLPALVLLLSGAGAWLVQRRQHPPASKD